MDIFEDEVLEDEDNDYNVTKFSGNCPSGCETAHRIQKSAGRGRRAPTTFGHDTFGASLRYCDYCHSRGHVRWRHCPGIPSRSTRVRALIDGG